MKTITIALLLMLISIQVSAQQKATIPIDKVLHFGAGAGIAAVTNAIILLSGGSEKNAMLYSLLAAITAGVLKETYDHIWKNSWDNKDLLATGLGGIIGDLSFTITIQIFKPKKNK